MTTRLEQRECDRREVKDRRRRNSERRHEVAKHRKYWVSPGARLWLAAVSCVLALGIVFLVIPFYRDRNASRIERQQEIQLRASQRAQGQALLHAFDCSYGQGVRLTLAEAARSATVSAHVALQARHQALRRHDTAAAHRSLISYRNSTSAASRYRHVAATLKPLAATRAPCK